MRAPELRCPAQSDTGAYRISWEAQPGAAYRLVEMGPERDAVVYQGSDSASTVTGRLPGAYRYKVGTLNSEAVGAWSEVCRVDVQPPSLALAFLFFGLGLVVCASTVVVVVRGHRAHRRGEIG